VPAYPKQRGPLDIDVAVIGGGLTDAWPLTPSRRLALTSFFSSRAGWVAAATGSSLGFISEEPGVSFADVEQGMGLRVARHAFSAWRRAALDFSALLRRLDVKCDLAACDAMAIATTPEQSMRLKREVKARRDAGLEAPLVTAHAVQADLAIASDGALREKGAALIDPYRACLGIAAAAAGRGAKIFERSPVRRTKFNRKSAMVVTEGGTLRTRFVIVATGAPTELFASLARHFWYRTNYLVLADRIPLKTRRLLGRRATILRDFAQPAHIARWVDDEQLMISGADQESPRSGIGKRRSFNALDS